MSTRNPSYATIAGRLRAERQRLGRSQPQMAEVVGVTKSALALWERGRTFPNALVLARYGRAGADVLFIVTGRPDGITSDALSTITVRQALAKSAPADRRRLLLELLAEEMGQ